MYIGKLTPDMVGCSARVQRTKQMMIMTHASGCVAECAWHTMTMMMVMLLVVHTWGHATGAHLANGKEK